jgi:ubiquinone/menaquinone biosynthesis C-methylase UbiE
MSTSTDAARIAAMKRAVEDEWADPRVAAAYRRWDRDEAEWGRAARDLVVDRARLSPGLRVVDIGSAHGEPGLAIAEAVGPTGHVTLVDLAPDLLDIAARRAREAGLRHVATRVADAHELPFEPGAFDRVTSRLAAMYFADKPAAFAESRRVLTPGGRAVFLVWGPVEQPMFSDIIGRLFKYVPPPDDDGSPSPFAFSQPGTLAAALTAAGFVDVTEEQATLPTAFPGPPSRWWEWIVDTGAPLQTWLASLSPEDEQRAVAEILDALSPYDDGQFVRVPIEVIVATGHAPTA